MRRPASSALPSYAPDGRRASSMTSAAGIATATAAPTQRWHTRWWVLFYVVLGCYAISVLGSFIVGLEPEPPTHQDGIHEQQRVLHHQKVVETGPIKVETAAKDPSEPEEGWPVQESEREDAADAEQGEIPGELEQEQEAAGEIGAREDEHAEAAPDKVAAPIGPASTIPSAVETQTALMNPTRQNDVVLLAATQEEEEKKELNGEPDDRKAVRGSNDGTSKDHNEAEADIQAPQEKWEVEDSGTNDAAETPGPLVTPTSDETQPPVRRSDEFYKALDLVYPYETKPPNPYFHVFPIEIHDKLISEEKDRLEDKRAASTLDIRRHQPRKIRNKLKCMGWRQTGQCNPYGKREPNSDLACNQIAQGGVSGYCEVLDEDSGELFRVMQLNCSSVRDHVVFSCAEAADFANFGLLAQGVYENALAQNTSDPSKLLGNNGRGNGIVMVVYPKLLSSVFASISILRSYNCTLPIELWISQPEVVRTPSMRTTLEMLQQRFSNVTVETIIDPTIAGFSTKIHAVQHSKFENVLFLDADNVPVRDPTFLFETQEFRQHGAIFWPDFWHPEKTIFNIQRESLLWELVDLPFVDMFEQESGQILIDRRRAAIALEVLMFFAYHRPSHFERLVLAHGDKDLFRLAWMKTQTPFYMMPFPPASAGTERGTYKKQFCGMTMVQFDVDGNVLFLHRNAKKLDGKVDKLDSKYWTHLQSFKWEQDVSVGDGEEIMFPANRTAVQRMMSYQDIKQKYQIGIQPSGPLFKEFETCYGAEPNVVSNYNLTKFEDLPFANLEQQLVDYAHEGALLMAQAQGRMGV
ncbi:hypothetical protein PC123_g8996 [Phytophthora cactorum]|nr:hypothetical protein PC123_g8996 [Phytophthora cactorum]